MRFDAGLDREAPPRCTIVAAGVTTGRQPRARARWQRSTSSPYMKKRGSKPPSSRQSAARIRKKQPRDDVDLADAVAGPAADVLGVEERAVAEGGDEAGGVAEGAPRASAGRSRSPGSGCRRGRACGRRRCRAPGWRGRRPSRSSIAPGEHLGVAVEQQQPLASPTVSAMTLFARAKPRFSGERISSTCGKAAATASAEPSSEALSSTTTRIGSAVAAMQRLEAAERQVAGVVADDLHGQRRGAGRLHRTARTRTAALHGNASHL